MFYLGSRDACVAFLFDQHEEATQASRLKKIDRYASSIPAD
jgi:hypothetical protein